MNRDTKQPLRDFDQAAARWDQEPRRVQLAHAVADGIIKEARPCTATRMLDFGCGTGLVTLALAPLVGEIVAADSSQGMLEQLTDKCVTGGITMVKPLLLPPDGSGALPDGERFDLVVSSMTMHHIADVGGLVKRFHDSLLSGGQLCIADLDREDGSFHDDPTGVQHNGFSRAEMESFLSSAGFVDIRTVRVWEVRKSRPEGDQIYPVHLTIGRCTD